MDLKELSKSDLSEFTKTFPERYKDFLGPIVWVDSRGVSYVKKYGDDHASLYKIGIPNTELNKSKIRKQLYVGVSYGKETPEGISMSSGDETLWSPVDLNYHSDFSYDFESKKFYLDERAISATEILAMVEETHLLTTRAVRGLILRLRLLFWRVILPALVRYVDIFFISLLWMISGEKIKDDIWSRLWKGHEKIDAPSLNEIAQFGEVKTMDFFGYKAKRWSVVFYSALHLSGFVIYSSLIPIEILPSGFLKFLTVTLENNFLSLCYVVLSFSITESLVPRMLKETIRTITPKAFSNLVFKTVKVRGR